MGDLNSCSFVVVQSLSHVRVFLEEKLKVALARLCKVFTQDLKQPAVQISGPLFRCPDRSQKL